MARRREQGVEGRCDVEVGRRKNRESDGEASRAGGRAEGPQCGGGGAQSKAQAPEQGRQLAGLRQARDREGAGLGRMP